MAKCPYYGNCEIDASVLADVGMPNTAAERFRYDWIVCKGDGRPSNQWENCVKYLRRNPSSLYTSTSNSSNSSSSSNSSNSSEGCLIGCGVVIVIFMVIVFVFF